MPGQSSPEDWRLRVPAALLCLLLCLALLSARPAAAQEAADGQPWLDVTEINVGAFPNVKVYVYGENLGGSLAATGMRLFENGAERPAQKGVEAAGYQVALVFDAPNSVSLPGITGASRMDEVKESIRRALQRDGNFVSGRDWVEFVATGPNATPNTVQGWDQWDLNLVGNAVTLYDVQPNAGLTPLNDLILHAVRDFDDPRLPKGQQRHIIVFSDGIDAVSVLDPEQAVALAKERGIRVHTVQLGNAGPDAVRRMKQIAELSDGVYVELNTLEAPDAVWEAVRATAEQAVLTYRSQRADAGEIRVEATLPNGVTVDATGRAPAVDVKPVAVSIVQPPEGFVLDRSAAAWDSPIEELSPTTLPIQASFAFPDGRPREIRQVEITAGGNTTTITEPPFDTLLQVPVASLRTGEYTVRVRAVDELGVAGESAPLRFRVQEQRPATPTPTPVPTFTPTYTPTPNATATAVAILRANATATAEAVTQGKITTLDEANQNLLWWLQRLSWATVATAVLALAALIFAIYVLSSRDRRKRATEIVTGTLRSVTEPFMRPGRRGGPGAAARAQLVLVDNGGTPTVPAIISLSGGSLRIGRDPAVSNAVLDDRRISRFHCQIREEVGGYRLLDEGSTSGTYVNDMEVSMHGYLLQPNDLVGIGPVVYRFEAGTAPAGGGGPSAGPPGGNPRDSTVPLMPHHT